IVLRGLAQIKTFSGDTIAEVGPGSVLGEVSLIDQEPRSATVVSSGDSVVAVIPADKLRLMMRHDMGMRCVMLENLARLICQRLRTANIQLDGVVAGASR
ncbi:MAG: cyclic nucleotide-binding domain-containing protein, partial [Armatimonadetes bacterium]|nr:cyclic nucleotide-binding domain-containing protein [Armatimonadota bacterium]